MIRFAAIFALLSIVAQPASSSDAALALADRATFPVERQPYLYYCTTEPVDPAWRDECETALRLVVPSLSRQPVLERCLPVQVGPTLWRLDLLDLGWPLATWADVIAEYPYRLGTVDHAGRRNSLLLRADWLLIELTDAHQSDAYYRLLFGGVVPKTRDEALAILGVDAAPTLQFGMIEGASGVSVSGVRLIRNLDAPRGYAWGTADVLQLTAEQDPIEQPEGDFKHDGEEWIVGVRKLHLASGVQGALQVYFLANGRGQIVDRAPVDLVEDHTRFRGLAEIRAAGSCIACHAGGLNSLKRNELRSVLAAGVDVWAYYGDQQQLEAFHFADLSREIARNNEDFAAIVEAACGCGPAMASGSYQAAVAAYDSRLDLDDAAHELGCDPAELKLALAWASARGYRLGARISSLAHGGSVPRRAWEQHYLAVEQTLAEWEQAR